MTVPPPGGDRSGDLVELVVDGEAVTVADSGGSLLYALRDQLGRHGPKDGCSPQGQCGCCTVLVDGSPRVACVTPLRRVAGRTITTVDGLDPQVQEQWAEALCSTGGSQCGFCTPGIVVRLAALHERQGEGRDDHGAVQRALQAHLCRCTGWQTVVEAWDRLDRPSDGDRDLVAATERATLESGGPQTVSPGVALGRGGFAEDTAPADALVAVPDGTGGWVVADTVEDARRAAGKVQGRRTTAPAQPPLEVPDGDWVATLRTSWVEPAYLETDASWCVPGGEPVSVLANGGAFGGKMSSPLPTAARELADRHGRPVRVLWSREDAVRNGPKRPPLAGGVRSDGTGVLRVARTPGLDAVAAQLAPGFEIEQVEVAGPPTSLDLRAAVWAEVAMLVAAARGEAGEVRDPEGGWARASVADGRISVTVGGGDPLDHVVLRSYVIGAAHMAFGLITSEGLSVAPDGGVGDLTIRSFGVVRAADVPPIEVHVEPESGPPVRVSDAAFAAVAAAVWLAQGCPSDLPSGTHTLP